LIEKAKEEKVNEIHIDLKNIRKEGKEINWNKIPPAFFGHHDLRILEVLAKNTG